MQTDAVRPKLFNIRFSEEEWARVERLASHYGINAASLFRMLLKKEETSVQWPSEPAEPVKKKARAKK